jgi:uncharacterized protein YegJ (DUF2314 family)
MEQGTITVVPHLADKPRATASMRQPSRCMQNLRGIGMKMFGQRFGFVVLVLLALSGGGAEAQEATAAGKDKTIIYNSGDAEMTAAIEAARQTLPDFWNMFAAPEPDVGQFSLKVAIRDGDKNITEHFWLGDLQTQEDGRIEGTINNVPNHVKSVSHGQRYKFGTDQITDWMFYRRGKIVGGHTIRPMLKRLPKERAEQIRRMLE